MKKISNIKDTQSKKEEEELKLKPKIQSTSEKMAQEKYKGEEVFSRLYNQNTKKTIEKDNLKKKLKKMRKLLKQWYKCIRNIKKKWNSYFSKSNGKIKIIFKFK